MLARSFDQKARRDGDYGMLFLRRGNYVLQGFHQVGHKGKPDWTPIICKCMQGEVIAVRLMKAVEELGLTEFVIEHYIRKMAGPNAGDMAFMFVGSTAHEGDIGERGGVDWI